MQFQKNGEFWVFRSNCFGKSDRKETIQELLGLLTERQKEVVFEYFWEQKSQSEIAEKLGVSHAAVSKILTRAVTRLRKKCMEWKEAI